MAKYPIFLELDGRRVVIIGAGAVAIRKARMLLAAGARLVMVDAAVDVDNVPMELFQNPKVELIKSKYSKNYLTAAALVIAATNNHQLNKQIYKDSQQLDVLCNVVDEPENSDFFMPALVKRGHLQIAISTEGHCPAYTGHLRKKLENTFTEEYGLFLDELETIRKDLIRDLPDEAERKVLLGRLVSDESFEYFTQNGAEKWRDLAGKISMTPESLF